MSLLDRFPVLVPLIALFSCNQGTTNGPGVRADAALPPVDSSPSESCADDCAVWTDYGELGLVSGVANRIDDSSHLLWRANTASDCNGDPVLVMMELLAGNGTLRNGIDPGTYVLEEDDFSMDTCGACIRVVAGNDTGDASCYLANGGTLSLAVVEERLSGHLEGVSFRAISCEDFSPLDNACSSQIDNIAFDDEYSLSE